MAENVFEAVKQSVSTREAAEFYGIEVKRNGMACCPFHDDKNPSMKVDQRFHCFGCGADGDVIDFTAKLFDLSPKEAAEKLAQDFGLIYDSQAPPRRRYVRQKTEAQKFREDRQRCYRVLSDYYYLLKKWEADNSPRTPEEEPHPRFVEAIQKKTYVEYLLDLFLYESEEEQKAWIAEHTAEITHLERRLKIMAENKPTNRERLREITDGIEQGIKELFESEKYMRYLSVMSRFHRYSVNNTMLIYMQKPDATLVAGYNKWKDQFERHVKKGEHGITIIAPTPYKKKIEEQKLDPDTKAPILDKDGKIVTEEKEIEIPMFRPVKVFDVSQTDGKPLPELASSLSGNVPNYEAFMEALRRSAPVPITFEAMAADTDGYFSADHQKIAIRQGMSEVQTVSATVHEIAHSKLHDPKKYEVLPSWKVVLESEGGTKHDFKLDFATEREAEQFASDMDWRYVDENQFEWRLAVEEDPTAEKQAIKNRHTEEVEAESISYAVCKYFGIETGENSFGYIASWSQGKELKELRASLETINKTSGTLISDIERHYKEICKERGIDPNAKAEPETAPIEQPADAAKVSDRQPTGNLTYYAAECMEFPNLGEYHDNLSLEEAIRIYQEIPAERMNGIKGIGFELKDGSDYEGPFPILTGQTIDLDTIQAIDYYRDNPLVQKAVKDLAEAMPEMEVLGADANQQEALFLIDGATYLHIQPCDSGWDYTLYDAASMKELDGGQLDMPELSCKNAVLQICDDNDLDSTSLRHAPLSMIETLQEAAYQQMQAGASQVAVSSQLPEAQEQTLDEYPTPDEQVSTPDMQEYGYSYETALSFAEIKALCAGDPRIKERMDLDVEVSRLKLMKADHQSKQYRLEDQLLKYFPEEIEKHKGFIKGFESDLEVLAAHPHPEDGFAGMEIRGDLLTDKENAGAALLDACKEVKTSDPVQIGSYRGYAISVEFSAWKQEYTLLLKGQMTHRATLGTDPRGNLTRIDNALAQMPQRLEAAKAQLDNLYQQQAAAKEEVGKPFLYEEELKSKNARLVELDTLLNIDGKGQAHAEAVVAKSARPSVLDHLKRPVPPRSTDKKPKQHEEVR